MASRWQRHVRARPWVADVSIALVSVFISFPGITVAVDRAPLPAPRWPGFLLIGIACAALAWARSRPCDTAAVTIACAIAASLFLSTNTVRTHIQRAMMKLHARDRAQLVVIAYQTGLVLPAPPP
jgi:hypothetical protein